MATIRKRNGKWQVQVRRLGQPTISRTFQAKEDAQRWAREQERLADLGDLSRRERHGDVSLTVGQLLERYIERVCPLKRGAGPVEIGLLRALVRRVPSLTELSLDQAVPARFAEYRDKRLRQASNDTVHRELGLLQHAFEVARTEWGIEIENPIRPLRKPERNRARDRRLRQGEWDKLAKELARCRNPLILPLVRLALATGMRRSELLSLTWSQVDFQRGIIALLKTKNGYPRQVPLTEEAIDVLWGLGRNGERLFPLSCNAVRMAWQRARNRAGLTGFRFHDLRHEAISRFFEMGLSLPEVSMISGHRDPRQLLRYTHLEAAKIAEKLRTSP
jgi:integrase